MIVANDPTELFAVADRLAEVADNFVKKPQYSLGPVSGFHYLVPDPTTTLKAGECFIRHNEHIIEGEVIMWRNPSYLASDIVQSTAVNNPYVAERLRVANLIVLPDGSDMNGSAADAMAGGDYDGDKAAFWLLKGRAFCPAARTPSTIPPMTENTLAGCATICVRDMIRNGYQIDDACAALFSTHEQGIKGRLTIPYFNAVTWRGATDPLTVKTAWYALRAMDCVKQNESTKELLKSMRRATKNQHLKPPMWKSDSALSTIGIGIEKGVPVEADPPLQTEYLQVLTKLRARAEALRWLCQSGRILDVVNGCAKYPVLINKAGAHVCGSADSVGGRTVGVGVFMKIKSH